MKKYKPGDIVTAKVTGISEYGIFVLLEDNTTGLIHISEISSSFVRNISDYVELNEVALPNSNIEFCDVTHYYANRVYANGLIYLINYAFNELYNDH